ncbi:crotonase/enoyl-CoA hydratase family protein [Erythrobacter sp. SCSIO 43205]|uniref:crotonase/enoyl-CoA hydratase family protein n=1 Tax=Erythrobacter sp. SCSIO 43205 TaxID=2779361 RepID=UPI001CA8BFDD|nr:crotonase/enoyl-CoA hydratase family protein [Erythrobacter sp. SCSIO 43205]UAB77265.1 crotonase/enoyl-CoA hydratase family protein [Erythrobacter sp. SCSIO 43205]
MDSSAGNPLPFSGDEEALSESLLNNAVPDGLFELRELDVLYDDRDAALWTYMRPKGRPSFTPAMLGDFERWQELISTGFGEDKVPLRYLVLGSRSQDVFCFGGDLELFQHLIRTKNRDALVQYGHRCCAILDRNVRSLGLPMVTIGLVQGAALGGGFEALLSFDYIIAERHATFGLPEIMFGLYPGMGAHAFLARKLGTAMAERIILSNKTYTAQEMYDLGLVHQIAEPGEGVSAVRDFIKKSERRHSGIVGAYQAMKKVWPIQLDELNEITELWADTALKLSDHDLKVMSRLVSAQGRLADRLAAA